MITVEDKLRTFSKYVYEKEVTISNTKLEELEENNQEVLLQNKKEIMDKCALLEEKMRNKMNMDSQKILSIAKMEAKNKSLDIRNRILNSLMDEIAGFLADFTDSEEYVRYFEELLHALQDTLASGKVIVSLTSKDIKKYGDHIRSINNNVAFIAMPEEEIGGIIVECPSTSERIDLTILSKLQSMKNEIGIRLYEALEK
ncbi:MAG: V-type ATP synthase subunit E [Eubacteriales bacterium]